MGEEDEGGRKRGRNYLEKGWRRYGGRRKGAKSGEIERGDTGDVEGGASIG